MDIRRKERGPFFVADGRYTPDLISKIGNTQIHYNLTVNRRRRLLLPPQKEEEGGGWDDVTLIMREGMGKGLPDTVYPYELQVAGPVSTLFSCLCPNCLEDFGMSCLHNHSMDIGAQMEQHQICLIHLIVGHQVSTRIEVPPNRHLWLPRHHH